jgi:hypothetical protein
MNVWWWVLGLASALGIGAISGWSMRRTVVTWCQACGLPVGRTCIECRDRARAHDRNRGPLHSSAEGRQNQRVNP